MARPTPHCLILATFTFHAFRCPNKGKGGGFHYHCADYVGGTPRLGKHRHQDARQARLCTENGDS